LVVLGAGSVGADSKKPQPADPKPDTKPKSTKEPWSEGVPVEQQNAANAEFAEANTLMTQQAHQPALEKYKSAIAKWDHPLIRFNMAAAEIRLDKLLEAAEDLDKALRYGADPFPNNEYYEQALNYQALLKGRIGEIAVSCDQGDVHLLLDGKPWSSCPGS